MPVSLSPRPAKININRFIEIFFPLFCLSFAVLILFARVVSAGVSHDEYQFVASSQVFASRGELPYIDYPFLHMPYQIPVNSIAVLLNSYQLLAVRCLNSFFYLTSILILFFLVKGLFKKESPLIRSLAGFLAALLFLFDPALISMDGRALNHALPVALSLSAFAIFQKGISSKRFALCVFLCGLLAGLAAGVRLSYAVLVVPFLTILLFFQPFQSIYERLKYILTFLAGLFLALLPVVILMLKAPAAFFFGNYVYIRLNTVYWQGVNFQESMTFLAKAVYFYQNVLARPTPLLLYFGLFLTALYLSVKLVKGKRDNIMLSLSVFLSFVLLASGFAPTPTRPQYFFAPVPFIIISVFSGLSAFQKAVPRHFALACAATALIAGFPFQQTVQQISVLEEPVRWTPVQAHHFAEQVREIAQQGKIVSLAPIYPLEAGLDTYPPFIVGPFAWRTAPLLSAEGRQRYQLVSFHELNAMLDADPPAAILTGFETDYGFNADQYGLLEKPFIDYAVSRHYKPYKTWKLDFWPADITIWVNPGHP